MRRPKRYIIEAQYLLPVYRRVEVVALSRKDAIERAKFLEEVEGDFWSDPPAKQDYESARPTTWRDVTAEEPPDLSAEARAKLDPATIYRNLVADEEPGDGLPQFNQQHADAYRSIGGKVAKRRAP